MLWYCIAKPGKLYVNWHGPFVVEKVISDVKYVIRHLETGVQRSASVQHLVAYYGEIHLPPGTEDLMDLDALEQDNPLLELAVHKFVIFVLTRDWEKARKKKNLSQAYLRVGEILSSFDTLSETIAIHHYVDLGSSDSVTTFDKSKQLADRRVKPELRCTKSGASFCKTSSTEKMRYHEQVISDYNQFDIIIVTPNFDMHMGGKIPKEICAKNAKSLRSMFSAKE